MFLSYMPSFGRHCPLSARQWLYVFGDYWIVTIFNLAKTTHFVETEWLFTRIEAIYASHHPGILTSNLPLSSCVGFNRDESIQVNCILYASLDDTSYPLCSIRCISIQPILEVKGIDNG